MIITAAFSASLFGLENNTGDPNDKISIAGTAYMESFKSGGGFELGFALFNNDKLSLRNFITVSGLGTTTESNAGILLFGDKIAIGSFRNSRFHTYGFIGGEFGLFAADFKKLFSAPFFWEIRGGGGIDIYVSPSYAFFTEFGGGFSSLTSDSGSYDEYHMKTGFTNITVGFRNYF